MSGVLRWGIPGLALLGALSGYMWYGHMSTAGDPTYAEDPSRWAGAPGYTVGLKGPLMLPALAAQAASDLHSTAALTDLRGRTLAEMRERLGEPSVLEKAGDRTLALWHSAVIMDELPLDRHPVAHLRMLLRGGGDSPRVEVVELIGSVGMVLGTTEPAAITP